ncbi:MAG: hypothetical protein MJ225_02895 [Bacilli bacterium]|nr:hypothetical protein [Bacilli bacterium]
MRNPNRIPIILAEIEKLWREYPDMRLGQLIGNVLEGPALYYIEDNMLIDVLKKAYSKYKS